MSEDKNYTCTLDANSLQKAQRELNEDPKEREGAIQTLREWVDQQKWLKTPTGMFVLFKSFILVLNKRR